MAEAAAVRVRVNGIDRHIAPRPGVSVPHVLRDELGLMGARYGCGEGACGACFVLCGGEAVAACRLMPEDVAGRPGDQAEGGSRARRRPARARAWRVAPSISVPPGRASNGVGSAGPIAARNRGRGVIGGLCQRSAGSRATPCFTMKRSGPLARSATLVVAGLKAEPCGVECGRPTGITAQNNTVSTKIHAVAAEPRDRRNRSSCGLGALRRMVVIERAMPRKSYQA